MTLVITFAVAILAGMAIRLVSDLQLRAERAEWREERAELLNRIQHPEIIIQPQPEVEDETPISFEDDQEYWRARGHLVTD